MVEVYSIARRLQGLVSNTLRTGKKLPLSLSYFSFFVTFSYFCNHPTEFPSLSVSFPVLSFCIDL
jgi:hypothetical protein